jgi:hypothetical protein
MLKYTHGDVLRAYASLESLINLRDSTESIEEKNYFQARIDKERHQWRSLVDEKIVAKCVFCGAEFELHGDEHLRSNRKYCSDSCKFKAYRLRKAVLLGGEK